MEELLNVKTKFESNRTYIAGCEDIHIYPEDTVLCTDPEVLASCRKEGKSCNVAFFLRDIENTVLDFHGAKLVFHGRIVPFVLLNCKNVTVKNLKIDYDRPFYTQADVLEVKPGEMRIKICDGFDYEIRDGYLYAKSETWEKNLNANDCLLWMYDKTEVKNYQIMLALFGKEIFPNENPPMPIRQLQISEQGGEQIIRGEFPEDWDYNSCNNALLITHEVRNKNTINILGCEDISIFNCTLIHGASLGIVGKHTRNLTVDHFDMYRDYAGNGRLVTNNADAIHLYNCSGKVTVTNCFMEGLLDDTVNIHNNYLSVKDVCEDRLVMYSRAAGLSVNLKLFNVGDSVAVYSGRTQEKVTELVITEMEIDEQEQVYRMTVEGNTVGILADDTVENLSAQPEILISGCTFGSFRGTMRLQSRGRTVVRDCEFRNKDISLLFTGDTTYWFESGPVNDMLIENCVFEHGEYSPRFLFASEMDFTERENYYHRNIQVKNCIFRGAGELARLSHVDGFTAENNRFDEGSFLTAQSCGRIGSDIPVREENK